jgi:hypothetical protein
MEVGLRETLNTAVANGMTVSVAPWLPLSVAVIDDVACEVTARLVTVKFAEVAPPATVTDAGTVAADVFVLDSATVIPAAGAGLLNVTVPVELVELPRTVVGLRDTDTTAGALTMSCAAAVPFNVAVIVGAVVETTAIVVTVKLAVLAPPGTVNGVVTDAAPLLLDSATAIPPGGDGPFNVTVPVEGAPPLTLVGLKDTDATVGGLIVSGTVTGVPFHVAVIFAVVAEVTVDVFTVKLAVVA